MLVENGNDKKDVMTDPFFKVLFGRSSVRWTYPKEVGFEDPVERRTIIEAANIADIDMGMHVFYQTILKDVPPGPGWIRDIAMISYDYMSYMGKGWYNDIDTLSKLISMGDRNKVALCFHGWYDIVGRYCYNEKTGKLDEAWTNKIRGIDMTLENLHHRIRYAKERGFRVLMYFADGPLSSKGLPDYRENRALPSHGYLWNGPDVLGGPYARNIAVPENYDFYRNYARALFSEFAHDVDGFVWDETFYIKMGNYGTPDYPGYLDRRQFRTNLKGLTVLPPYFEFKNEKID